MESVKAKPRKWLVRLVIAVMGVVAFALLALFALILTGSFRESRAIDEVRARGEPLTPAEIEFPAAADSDLLERTTRFVEVLQSGPTFRFVDVADGAELLAELRAAPAWEPAVEPCERLLACFGDHLPWSTDLDGVVDEQLADPRTARDLAPCELQFLRARITALEPLMASAREVCGAAPDSGERATRAWTYEHGPGRDPDRTPIALFSAVQISSNAAVARAVDGHAAEAIESLELAFRGAGLLRGWPSTSGFGTGHGAQWQALRGLRSVLALLPRDADLSRIEAAILAFDPRADLERALVAERAFGNEMFAALRDGRLAGSELSKKRRPDLMGLVLWSLTSHDRAFYLRTMGRGAEYARRPYSSVVDEVESWGDSLSDSLAAKSSMVSMMLVPNVPALLKSAAGVEAGIALARAAIRAHAEGVEAGRAAAASLADPFGTGPLHSRVDPDGTLILWSVGADLVDDGGEDAPSHDPVTYETADPSDIVWRVAPR